MPLPPTNSPWPPPGYGEIHQAVETWSAWYESSPRKLAHVYGGAAGRPGGAPGSFFGSESGVHYRPSQYRGGLVGTVARMFWGEPPRPEQRSPKLHVPAAADIATTSADILFGEEPTLTCRVDTAQARLDELTDERFWATIIAAATMCAGLGGVYLRVGWDTAVDDRPLLSVLGPDIAYPTFRWGRLAEVTFCWVLHRSSDGDLLRHLEHHSPGRVEHGLYLGDEDSLGRQVPLTEHPQTAGLADAVDESSSVPTGLPGLDVLHVPNTENRAWRNHPLAQNLGQPDIAGVEPLLDALDEAMTSWMRDLRLGKARAVVPQNYLDAAGRGKGAGFDLDRELFVGVNALPASDQMPLHVIQTAIRHEQHAATVEALLERALAGAGYSAQTFGLVGEVPITATETLARERRTLRTRASKIRRWRPALAELAELMLTVDALVFGGKAAPERPDVEFPPYAQDGLETNARSVQMLHAAESMSTPERVRVLHPDWDKARVDEEVAAIAAERPVLPDPFGDLDSQDPDRAFDQANQAL